MSISALCRRALAASLVIFATSSGPASAEEPPVQALFEQVVDMIQSVNAQGHDIQPQTSWTPQGINYWPYWGQLFRRDSQWDWVTMMLDDGWTDPLGLDCAAVGYDDCTELIHDWLNADLALMAQGGITEIRVPLSWVYTQYPWGSGQVPEGTDPSVDKGDWSGSNFCYVLDFLFDRALAHGIRVTLATGWWHQHIDAFEIAADPAFAEEYMAYTLQLVDQCNLEGEAGLLAWTLDLEASVEFCGGDRDRYRNIGSSYGIALWNDWIDERYGSLVHAEARWSGDDRLPRVCAQAGKPACPPEDDPTCFLRRREVCPPPDSALNTDLHMPRTVKAFRRFISDVINERFQRLTGILRSSDPTHSITSDGGLPDRWCNHCFSYVTRDTTKYLDFGSFHMYLQNYGTYRPSQFLTTSLEYEEKMTLLESAAAVAYLAPERRLTYAGETGSEAAMCSNSGFKPPARDDCVAHDLEAGYQLEGVQANLHDFGTGLMWSAGATGHRWWWWIGRRPMTTAFSDWPSGPDEETSDFGVLRVTSTDDFYVQRPILADGHFSAARSVYAQPPVVSDTVQVNPLSSVCLGDVLEPAYAQARVSVPAARGLKVTTQCTGTDSASAALSCVDSGADGSPNYWHQCDPDDQPCCALLCMNALFDKVLVRNAAGVYVPVEDGATAKVPRGGQARFRVQIGNLGEARWLHQGTNSGGHADFGQTRIVVSGGDIGRVNLSADVATFDSTEIIEFVAVNAVHDPQFVELKMVAEHRAMFGETYRIQLEPAAGGIVGPISSKGHLKKP